MATHDEYFAGRIRVTRRWRLAAGAVTEASRAQRAAREMTLLGTKPCRA
jgi:hypothetical protein